MNRFEHLPPSFPTEGVMEVLSDFEAHELRENQAHFEPQGFIGEELEFISGLWRAMHMCFNADALTRSLKRAGFDATSMYNPNAFSDLTELHVPGGDIVVGTTYGHIASSVLHDDTRVYIDPYWQQFPLREAGVDLAEVHDNRHTHLLPCDDVLMYQQGDMQTIADLYATTVRFTQEKVARGELRGKIPSFTRDYSPLARLTGTADTDMPPTPLHSYTDLRQRAYSIWHPREFITMSDEAIEQLMVMSP